MSNLVPYPGELDKSLNHVGEGWCEKAVHLLSVVSFTVHPKPLSSFIYTLELSLHQASSHELNPLNCHPTKNSICYWTQSPLLDWKVRKSCEHWVLPPQDYLEFKIMFILYLNPRFGQNSAGHFISVPLKLSEDMSCSCIQMAALWVLATHRGFNQSADQSTCCMLTCFFIACWLDVKVEHHVAPESLVLIPISCPLLSVQFWSFWTW